VARLVVGEDVLCVECHVRKGIRDSAKSRQAWNRTRVELPGVVETQEIDCQQGGVAVFLSRLSFWLLIKLLF